MNLVQKETENGLLWVTLFFMNIAGLAGGFLPSVEIFYGDVRELCTGHDEIYASFLSYSRYFVINDSIQNLIIASLKNINFKDLCDSFLSLAKWFKWLDTFSSLVYRRIHLLESTRYIVLAGHEPIIGSPCNKVSCESSLGISRTTRRWYSDDNPPDTYPLFEVLLTHLLWFTSWASKTCVR